MRFGQELYRFRVVEWAPWYIDYGRLKCLFRNAEHCGLAGASPIGESGALALPDLMPLLKVGLRVPVRSPERN